jgi:phosphatidylserine decarboxylase
MKHAGKARSAAFTMLVWTLIAVLGLIVMGVLAQFFGAFALLLASVLVPLWVVFAGFALYFFRDPEAKVPFGPGLVVSPGHGKVDAIETFHEPRFMGGECQRVSIFLSVFNVHVQNTPVSGRVAVCKHTDGDYLNALKAESAHYNENVYIGFEAADPAGEKVGVRLIAGAIARRIIPWVEVGEEVARGERMSLIQFGSRVDVYLSPKAKIKVALGDKVVGGESVIAAFE